MFHTNGGDKTILLGSVGFVLLALLLSGHTISVSAQTAAFTPTTTITVDICGNGAVEGNEFCDDGINTGAYSTSTAGRICNNNCTAFGPYCGDGTVQTFNGEECDDGNNTDGDLCDALCQNEEDPVVNPGGSTSGGGGGGGGGGGSDDGNIELDNPTEVFIQGLAYPGATVNILLDGNVEEVVEADSTGEFEHTFDSLTPGVATFGFWAEDGSGRKSITFSTTFEVTESAGTTLSGIYIPPTIEATPQQMAQGETVTFVGEAAPNVDVLTHIDNGEHVATTTSASTGEYLLAFNTSVLTNESFHGVKALYRDSTNTQIESGFSQIVNFYVGVSDSPIPEGDLCPRADIDSDGRVNLTDFSILLFNWGTADAAANINFQGLVDLTDFSVLLFCWTG